MRAVCDIIRFTTENNRTRLTTGGNLIAYPGYVSTPTSDFTTMKIHVNRAISDVKERYMFMELKYFYLNNMMDREGYIMIKIAMITNQFVEK